MQLTLSRWDHAETNRHGSRALHLITKAKHGPLPWRTGKSDGFSGCNLGRDVMNGMTFAIDIIRADRAVVRIDHHSLVKAARRFTVLVEEFGMVLAEQCPAVGLHAYQRAAFGSAASLGHFAVIALPIPHQESQRRQ